MTQDISAMTLAEACEEISPEAVVEYVVNWCRHEADNLEEGRRSTADEGDDEDCIREDRLRKLAYRLEPIVS